MSKCSTNSFKKLYAWIGNYIEDPRKNKKKFKENLVKNYNNTNNMNNNKIDTVYDLNYWEPDYDTNERVLFEELTPMSIISINNKNGNNNNNSVNNNNNSINGNNNNCTSVYVKSNTSQIIPTFHKPKKKLRFSKNNKSLYTQTGSKYILRDISVIKLSKILKND